MMDLWSLLGQSLCALALLVLVRVFMIPPKPTRRKKHRAVVVVGGDFARSPRMQYHAVSLSDSGLYSEVVCVGMYYKNQCCEDLRLRLAKGEPSKLDVCPKENAGLAAKQSRSAPIKLMLLPVGDTKVTGNWIVRTLKRVLGFVTGFGSLLWMAMESTVTHDEDLDVPLVLVQTPPAVPFVPLIKMVRSLMQLKRLFLSAGSKSSSKVIPKLVVDWHNFGFTLLAIDRRPAPIVWFYKFCEKNFCQGDHNLTVSEAMKGVLTGTSSAANGGGNAAMATLANGHGFRLAIEKVTVLPDTAPSFFGPCSRKEFLAEVVGGGKEDVKPPAWFKAEEGGNITKSSSADEMGRTGLTVVSATSWTADDDYTILVDALKKFQKFALKNDKKIWAIVTGKGESRPRFEQQIKEANLNPSVVTVTTVYFQSFKHYARMLGASDIGLSLHQSSSGWDLPMKVVDMFGCGLPVAATNYPALAELVTHDRHGWLFDTADELCTVFEKLLSPTSTLKKDDEIAVKRECVLKERGQKWNETWKAKAVPILRRLLLSEAVAIGDKPEAEYQHVKILRDDE